ncbi:MAG: terminase small subunit [Anoxybacillus ayderensis]|uniref:Phage terminase small subunit n=1 Tax=Anoxybacillus tengchongensis TaxID=576944 RepID=A0A7W9YQC2_9BACL|nr:terminase small subunit [Anoxybacillus tengchongensis]MBB6176393.1 phage terminase small subunit [Anoxybacillus tengchongensis]MCL6616598.1 terminase small subunit [Anoxybacillus ayderensis]
MAQLTEKQKRFADEYLIDLNATQAAIRAGYSPRSAAEQASRLLKNAKVRAYIDERMAELSRRTGVNQERILRELARIAFVNAPELINMEDATIREDATIDDMAAIASVRVKVIPTENGQGIEREIRLADKIRALDLLGKRFAMWTERQQIDANFGVQIIDDVGGTDEED